MEDIILREAIEKVPKEGASMVINNGKYSTENLDNSYVRVCPVEQGIRGKIKSFLTGVHPVIIEYGNFYPRKNTRHSKKFKNNEYEAIREWINEISNL